MDNTFNQAFKPLSNIKTIKEYETEIEALRNENFDLKSRINQNYNSNVVTDDIKKLLVDSQTSINILENENKGLKEQIQFLKNGNDNHLKVENDKLLNYIEKMNEQVDAQNERNVEEKEELYREICNLKEKIVNFGNLSAKNNELQQQYNLMNEELQRKDNSYKHLQAQYNKEMQVKVNEYESKIRQANDEIVRLKNVENKASRIHEEISEKMQKLSYLEQQNHELQNKINKLETANASYQHMLSGLEREKQLFENKIAELNNFIEESQKQRTNNMNGLEGTLAELRNKNNTQSCEIMNYKDNIRTLKMQITNLEKENDSSKQEATTLKNKVRAGEVYVTNLQGKINKYEIQVNKIKQEYSKLQKDLKNIKEQKEYLETQVIGKSASHSEKEIIKQMEEKIDTLVRANGIYKKILHEESKNKKKMYETMLNIKNRFVKYIHTIIELRNKSHRSKEKENDANNKHSYGQISDFLSSRNIVFLNKLCPNQKNLNNMISELTRVFDKMNTKIDTLESELKQITYFAENNAKNKNVKTLKLIENFVSEFQSAKEELEFCKNYLKEKGKELKELRRCKQINEARILELEKNIKNKQSGGGFMDFFTTNKQVANR